MINTISTLVSQRLRFSLLLLALLVTTPASIYACANLYSTPVGEVEQDFAKTLGSVAHEIEDLKDRYPQLKEFSVEKHFNVEKLQISYEYHTHRSDKVGGWTSGVPNLDDDGIWFFIDVHEPTSTAQLHTQPVTVPICLADKKVTFLILEGKATESVDGAIRRILESRGVRRCGS